jgi:very-short-patch-repair endonuclease
MLAAMYRNEDQRNFARRLRNEMTEAEKRLWRYLRAQQLHGHKFRRQVAIGPYVVDFVCLAQKLIIELDGPQHCETTAAEHDGRRTAWLESLGYGVLRFRNHQLDDDIHAVVDEIARALANAEPTVAPPPSPTLPSKGREPEEP